MTYLPQSTAPFGSPAYYAGELRQGADENGDVQSALVGIVEAITNGPLPEGEKLTHIRNAMAGAELARGATPQSPIWTAAPAPRRQWGGGAVVVAAVLLLLATGASLLFLGVIPNPLSSSDLSRSGAETACRAAFDREWSTRKAGVDSPGDSVASTLRSIELLETEPAAGGGYTVNAMVKYTLTSPGLGSFDNQIPLTCTATGSGRDPVTSVKNWS